jgi:hypothetical protein
MKRTLLLGLTAIAAGANAQNIVNNPGFEMDSYPASGYVSTTSVTAWNFVGNSDLGQEVAGIGVGYLGAPSQEIDLSGAHDVYVDGMGPGISQTLNTIAGQTYTIALDYYSGNDFSGGAYAGGVDYYLNGSLIAGDLQTSSASDARQTYTGSFVAVGNDTISFLSNHGQISHVDNVDVEQAVPEPISMTLLGLGAFAAVRRRKN